MFPIAALLGGWRLYVLVALVLTFAGLSLAVAYYRNAAGRAEAEAALALHKLGAATETVKAQEKANRALVAAKAALDAAIVERERRARNLENERRKLQNEIDTVKQTLPPEDKGCLDRDLPGVIADRLRR